MAQAPPAENAGKKGRGLLSWVVFAVVAVLAAGAGFAVPMFLPKQAAEHTPTAPKAAGEAQEALVPFGEVVSNLAEDRLNRYLRVNVILVVDAANEKAVTDAVQKKKALMRNWLLSYLSDQTLQGVTGAVGQNRIRREILDQFNAILFPDGSEKIRNVIFEEFNVQ